jgi:inner membrane protease subunit 2
MAIGSFWARFRAHRTLSPLGRFGFSLFIGVTWVPVLVSCLDHVAEPTLINGASMYPFLNPEKDQSLRQDVALNWKFNPRSDLARGMVVVFRYALLFVS